MAWPGSCPSTGVRSPAASAPRRRTRTRVHVRSEFWTTRLSVCAQSPPACRARRSVSAPASGRHGRCPPWSWRPERNRGLRCWLAGVVHVDAIDLGDPAIFGARAPRLDAAHAGHARRPRANGRRHRRHAPGSAASQGLPADSDGRAGRAHGVLPECPAITGDYALGLNPKDAVCLDGAGHRRGHAGGPADGVSPYPAPVGRR